MQIQDICRTLKNKWVIVDLMILVAALVTLVFTLLYMTKCVVSRAVISRLEHDVTSLESVRERFQCEMDKYKSINKELTAVFDVIIDAAHKSHVRLDCTTVSDAMMFGEYRIIPIKLEMHGTYNQIGFFMNLVEKNILIKACDLILTRDDKEASISAHATIEVIGP